MNDQPATSGFTTGLDRKIEASKRRAAEERAAAGHGKPPTQGLTDMASTANSNIPARKPANITSVGYKVENIAEVGDGARLQGRVMDRVVFDVPITVREGDTIHMKNGKPVVTHAEDPKTIIEELAPGPVRLQLDVPIQPINMIPKPHRRIPIDQVCTVGEAFERLKLAMQDPGYAIGWHASLAMAFFDAEQGDTLMTDREHAQRAAALFMERCFDVDTSEHAKRVTQPPDILGAIQTIERRDVARARFLSGSWDIPTGDPAAPGGLNEMKARALERMGFGSTIIRRADGNAPEKADLSDAASMTYTRRLTLDELGDLFPKKD